jgi:hypothetical protein
MGPSALPGELARKQPGWQTGSAAVGVASGLGALMKASGRT